MKAKLIHAPHLKGVRLSHPDLSATWLDTSDVLRLLHCSERTLQKLRSAGAFPFYKVSTRILLYKFEEVQAFINSRKTDNSHRHDQ